jgi:hypothetical protein
MKRIWFINLKFKPWMNWLSMINRYRLDRSIGLVAINRIYAWIIQRYLFSTLTQEQSR